MKKPIQYILAILAVILVLYLSLDIEKLEAHKATDTGTEFNAAEYARNLWDSGILTASGNAPELNMLLGLLETDPESAYEEYGHKLGISSTWYFMASGEGIIEKLEEDDLMVALNEHRQIRIATGFIFGNAVRDGSGAVDINEFVNMTGFNNVSVELNNMVKQEVVPELKNSAQVGMKITFTGAFEFAEDSQDLEIRIIPVSTQLVNE